MLRICSVPREGGYMPVMSVLREGAHTGAVEKAFLYRILPVANWSRLGVVANLSP
ncbi:hypothetical protein D3C86_2128720 [compost metagenome]